MSKYLTIVFYVTHRKRVNSPTISSCLFDTHKKPDALRLSNDDMITIQSSVHAKKSARF